MNSLSVIIPVYNEEKNLENAFLKTSKSLNELGLNHEVIIVDDASQDRTVFVAKKLSGEFPNVFYCQHEKNQGIGSAFRTGIKKAALDYVILLPADNPFSKEDLQPYVEKMGNFDIVAGERKERVGYSAIFQLLSWGYNRILIPKLFNLPLTDVNWIQMYRRKIFAEGWITIECSGIFFFAEVLIKAHRKNFSITTVPAKMKDRLYGKPTITRFSVILKTFWDMLKFLVKLKLETVQKTFHCNR